jgi:hypothetical protein
MLTKVVNSVSSVTPTNKTIAVTLYDSQQNGAIMYTVPSGKKFVGWLGHSAQYYLSINSNEVGPFSYFTGGPWQIPIQLTEGAVVKAYGSTAGASYLQGIESDA